MRLGRSGFSVTGIQCDKRRLIVNASSEALFQRSPEHFESHLQTPFDHLTSYAALAQSSRLALVAFPLGQGYYNQGFWLYRQAFQKALGEVLPVPLIQTDAHLSTELSLTHQAAKPGRKERYMVHIVNYSPVRKTPKHTDLYDDPVPLSNVTVRVNLPLKVSAAKALYAGTRLPVRRAAAGGVEVLVPRVVIHEVVCFELHDVAEAERPEILRLNAALLAGNLPT